ncbi:MAG: DegV family protein [Ilumatobacteraceae bacterium]
MTPPVRVVTDSNAMIPTALVEILSITVVPLTVTIGGEEFVEDASLDVPAVYRRLRAGEPVTTSAPSPGAFVDAYRTLGPGPIVSVHIGADYSVTLDSARLGARLSEVDVVVVDTGTASFLAGCCVLSAAEAARDGADPTAVVAASQRTAHAVASVFTLAEVERARAGGRLGSAGTSVTDGTAVLHVDHAGVSMIGTAATSDVASATMLDRIVGLPFRLRIGVGDADAGPVVDELLTELRRRRPADDIIRYVVGPTVAAHAGMGTFGVVYHPLDDSSA